MDNPELPIFIITIAFLIFASSFFALSETAITESHKSRLERLADEEGKHADDALKILDDPEKLLSVVQVGITFTSILIGLLIGGAVAPILAEAISFLPYSHLAAAVASTAVTLRSTGEGPGGFRGREQRHRRQWRDLYAAV